MDKQQEVISKALDIKLVIGQIQRCVDDQTKDSLCEHIEDLCEDILELLDARS